MNNANASVKMVNLSFVFQQLSNGAIRILLTWMIILTIPCLSVAQISNGAEQMLVVGGFSTSPVGSKLPLDWEPLTFKKIKRHTEYKLSKVDNTVVVIAESNSSASGLIRRIQIDPKEYSILSWKWKVTNIFDKGDISKKAGDDFPARIFVTFEYDPQKLGIRDKAKYEAARLLYGEYPPRCAITYIWGNRTEKGAVIPNPFIERAVMIVVESGQARLNKWVEVTRNVYEDYKTLFHEAPPMISGVAIMTDSDNTGESATAYYGDIIFQKSP